MKIKYIFILAFLVLATPSIGQNNSEFGNWVKEIKTDDFGDFKNYYFTFLNYDKFSYNHIFIKLEADNLMIYHAYNPTEFIRYNKQSTPYTIKTKVNNIYEDKTTLVSSKTGSLVISGDSNLYKQITNSTGKIISVVIYDNEGERINSFDVISFKPIFNKI